MSEITINRNLRKVRIGKFSSSKMDKSIVVEVERKVKHAIYGKFVKKTSSFMAHDEENQCRLGDVVRIEESRPLSKDKRWRVIEVLTRGDVAEVAPATIGRELEAATQVAPKHEDTEDSGEAAEA